MSIAPQWIKDMYLQVADELCNGKEWCWHGTGEPLQRFAALVAQAERKRFVAYPAGDVTGPCVCGSWPGGECLRCDVTDGAAAAIRARGEKP